MKGTRLSEILSSLTIEEFKKLGEYLQSPYLNKNKQVMMFYYFLSAKNAHPDYSEVSRHEIFPYVYKDQKFNLGKYLKLSSDFVKCTENFMILELRAGREFQNQRTLLEIAGNKNLPKTFLKYSGEIKSKLENEFNKDLDFYLAEYESKVEAMLYEFGSKKFDLPKALRDIDSTVDSMILHSKLEMMIKLQNLSEDKKGIWLDKEVKIFAEKNKKSLEKEHPMIYLRSLILRMFKEDNKEIYKLIKTYMADNVKRISKDNLLYLCDKMLSFCNITESAVIKEEEFRIIKFMEKNGLLHDRELDYVSFMKIIESALTENDAYWAEGFIKHFSDKIDEEFRESTINLAMASICIYRQKFKEAMEYVSKVGSINDYFYINARTMSLIINYELKDYKSINFTIEAFGTYIKRNKSNLKFDIIPYTNFLRLFKKLVSKQPGQITNKKHKLVIINGKRLVNKDWLLRTLTNLYFNL